MTAADRLPRAVRMTIRVYSVDPATGVTTTLRPTTEAPSGWALALPPPPMSGYPPCRCPRCRGDRLD